MGRTCLLSLVLVGGLVSGASGMKEPVRIMESPDTTPTNAYYVGQRAPLLPSPLVKLPIGAIAPAGWLRTQLERQAEGFVGHLTEISPFLKKEGNAWLSKDGEGHSPWEEVPYWLKGFGDTGYVLGDGRIISEARAWIEAAIASQRDDGYFGPRENLARLHGKPDLWPNMIMLNVLQSYYEYTGDDRVLSLMTKYFHWELTIPDEDFLLPYWQQQRAADNLASVLWLYNRTGDESLLELAHKTHRDTANWTEGVANWHGVNIAQAFRGPGNYYPLSKEQSHLDAVERNYQTVMGIYGQVPGGMFGADENCREGYVGPRQAAETCTMVEFMLSFEMLLAITGDPGWADRCEEIAFNSLPASLAANLKALRYLTAPNLPQSDHVEKCPGVQNGGPMFEMNPHSHRCCQHNVAHGWPYFAEHLWMATAGHGLAAVLYAPCQVQAKVGPGIDVTIQEETAYPFEDTINLTIRAAKNVQFPLYLRVPDWCAAPTLKVNGHPLSLPEQVSGYVRIDQTWADGDRVQLQLPMTVQVKRWKRNHDTVSVHRGPLTYSLKIGEKYVRHGGTDEWPAFDIFPTTAWNYGLVLDEADPASSFELKSSPRPIAEQPFTVEAAPIQLLAKARKIPQWKLDHTGLIHEVQDSPARVTTPEESVTLIPMGCARLRIAAFPTVSSTPDAHTWIAPKDPLPASASHSNAPDPLAALSDGLEPSSSSDTTIPRFTWWDHQGTTEWVQYDFEKPIKLSQAQVYWYDDTGHGKCRPPQSWRLLYRVGDDWRPVSGTPKYGTEINAFNVVAFEPVETTGLRLEVQLQDGFSAGILEWRVK